MKHLLFAALVTVFGVKVPHFGILSEGVLLFFIVCMEE